MLNTAFHNDIRQTLDHFRRSVDQLFDSVQGYPAGWLLLLAIGLGLMAFGVYSLAEARYRHVSPR